MATKYRMKPEYRSRLGNAEYELDEYIQITNCYKMLDRDCDVHMFSGEFVEKYMDCEVVDGD